MQLSNRAADIVPLAKSHGMRSAEKEHTSPIDMVERAKGSPAMLPISKTLRLYDILEFSIFRREGECREP